MYVWIGKLCTLTCPAPHSPLCCSALPHCCARACRLRDAPRAVNQALLERINATGRVFLIHTELSGQYTLRLAVGGAATQARHVQEAWVVVQQAADAALAQHAAAAAAP